MNIQKSRYAAFHEWYTQKFSNANELANALGVNSGRIYKMLVTEKIPDKLAPMLKALGCPIVFEEQNKNSHGFLLKQWLIDNNVTNREIATRIATKPQYITNLFSTSKFSKKNLTRFKAAGVDIFSKTVWEESEFHRVLKVYDYTVVRRINAEEYSRYSLKFKDVDYVNQLPTQFISVKDNGKYRSFEMAGDSMEPEFPQGCLIDCKFLDTNLWNKIQRGHIYAFVHKELGLQIKLVVKQDKQKITLRSINEFYEDNEINLNDVQEIWYFVQKHDTNKDYSRYLLHIA